MRGGPCWAVETEAGKGTGVSVTHCRVWNWVSREVAFNQADFASQSTWGSLEARGHNSQCVLLLGSWQWMVSTMENYQWARRWSSLDLGPPPGFWVAGHALFLCLSLL